MDMNDPRDTDAYGELKRAFDGLTSQAGAYAGLMLNYAFYFIKNILSYKLVRMMGDKGSTYDVIESVAGFKACADICAGQKTAETLPLIIPGARAMLRRPDGDGAKSFLDEIFNTLSANAYGDIRTLFYDCTGQIINEAEHGEELSAFTARYLNASMAYRPETFLPWAAELSASVAHVKRLLVQWIDGALKQLPHGGDVKKTGYQIKKTVAENIMLADELADAFRKIPDYAAADLGIGVEDDAGIINGICETIKIKLESLKESRDEYRRNMDALTEEYTRGFPEINEDDCAAAADEIFEKWSTDVSGDEMFGAGSLYDLIAATERYGAFIDKTRKYMERMRESYLKRDYAYKRDCLLYEISTYNEIMNYSVSRLRESARGEDGFVAVCDNVLDEISVIIQKNNITAINPAPREMFNGKEHEVLLAEEHEHFVKGMIIKVLNPGYRYGDMILARATVIAAK